MLPVVATVQPLFERALPLLARLVLFDGNGVNLPLIIAFGTTRAGSQKDLQSGPIQ